MTDAVFSAEYAGELVQRARDGATWICVGGKWRPVLLFDASIFGFDYDTDASHWREWCREQFARKWLMFGIADNAYNEASWAVFAEIKAVEDALDLLIAAFVTNADALGSLCQLPDRWSDECRETARGM